MPNKFPAGTSDRVERCGKLTCTFTGFDLLLFCLRRVRLILVLKLETEQESQYTATCLPGTLDSMIWQRAQNGKNVEM